MVFKKGNVPHNRGKKASPETRIKISKNHADMSGENNPMFGRTGEKSPLFGKQQPKEWQEKKSKALTGRKRPDLSMKGENNPTWKGGVTPLNHLIRSCSKYTEWRMNVFQRDLYICQHCGKRGCYIEAHHIKEFAASKEENNITTLDDALVCDELWNTNNGITLCKECHDRIPQ
jgi:5-methylcytosine-specific restriction endonuclease McrA